MLSPCRRLLGRNRTFVRSIARRHYTPQEKSGQRRSAAPSPHGKIGMLLAYRLKPTLTIGG